MTANRAYLDYNASAPLTDSARAAMVDALAVAANPSSVHAEGRAAKRMLEEARAGVAALVNGRAEHVVFTSGATEAATLLLTPDWTMGRAPLRFPHLYVSAADHPCILKGGRFAAANVTRIAVRADGLIDLDDLAVRLARHDRAAGLPLLAMHLVNNETGTIQPAAEIGRIAREAGAVTVFDAVQAAGRIPLDISEGYADYLVLSSHKIGGPKGAGAVVSAADLMMPSPLVVGGGQEKGHRAGTENLPAAVGFGVAAREALAGLAGIPQVTALRDRIEDLVRTQVPDAVIHGADAPRVGNTSFFSIPGMKAETAQIAFDLAGVAVSAGSACSSGRVGPSHVLQAMGHGDQASALRVSIGHGTTDAEIGLFADALAGLARRRKGNSEAA
ncbi:cysteine desulfurase family protein [Nitratireductor pacificus]|uniref:Cysteine desulfurase n=1 Tax=Nitratireductor pacificus pht-3B TaxID=391937 RepID=K2MZ85_9HYPH|nr:cysteine desulfurase family protein [Nitratireductor pacificus]EKF17313.1 nitrogenase cofactor synthesis protein nifS [Nitratireductor pacificus pht-3B]